MTEEVNWKKLNMRANNNGPSIDNNDVTSLSQGKTAGPTFIGLPQINENNGEPWRARTSDPLIKSQLLYQLS